ncbi:MAG: hypothetical protein EU547_03210 [Promethearchaeota archaeon]|nr:MAG: hypothetical protein EU547_03210 [Candidatus Lokiarchaeota archaeon]
MQFNKYLFWGFTQDPSYMTENATKLFINAVNFLIGPPEITTTEPIPGFEIWGFFIAISLMILFLIRKRKIAIKSR